METYLVHHGILGQKWGVRRFQNSDGSLTEAGRKRYSDDAKGHQRRLNDYEKAIARNKILAKESTAKAERALNKSEEAKSESKREKQKAKYEEAVRDAKRYTDYAKTGEKEVARMLKDIETKYDVSSKQAFYDPENVHTGVKVTKALLAAGFGALAIYSAGSTAAGIAALTGPTAHAQAAAYVSAGSYATGASAGASLGFLAKTGEKQEMQKYKVRRKKDG